MLGNQHKRQACYGRRVYDVKEFYVSIPVYPQQSVQVGPLDGAGGLLGTATWGTYPITNGTYTITSTGAGLTTSAYPEYERRTLTALIAPNKKRLVIPFMGNLEVKF